MCAQTVNADVWVAGAIGILGAMIGSIVTVTWTEFFNSRERKRQRRERLAAGAFAVYQKLNRIYSASLTTRDYLNEGIRFALIHGTANLCQAVVPLSRLPIPVEFSVDELWALTGANDIELLNETNSLDLAFNSLGETAERYDIDRHRVFEELLLLAATPGAGSDAQKMQPLLPRIAELDGLILQMQALASDIVRRSFGALRLLVFAKAHPLGKTFEISVPAPDGTGLLRLRAQDAPARP